MYSGPQYSPSLLQPAPDETAGRLRILAELDLLRRHNTPANATTEKELADYYRHQAELYALHFEQSLQTLQQLMAADGALAEMYLEVYKHEQSAGPSPVIEKRKTRLLIIQRAIEGLRGYMNKYEEAKYLLKQSLDERDRLGRECERLRREVEFL